MGGATATGAGNMMVSVVPFTHLVNVADTCNAGADGHCRLTLADARDAGTQGHCVDSFHEYGAGTRLGPLRRRLLPDAFWTTTDLTVALERLFAFRRNLRFLDNS